MEIKDEGTGLVHDKVPELATCMLPKMYSPMGCGHKCMMISAWTKMIIDWKQVCCITTQYSMYM
jgi:hypothetical protein